MKKKSAKKTAIQSQNDNTDIVFEPLHETFGVDGMNTPNIRGLINHFAKNANCYVEIGSYQGSTLCAAAYNNENTKVIGVDNFSWANKKGRNEQILKEATKRFNNVEFLKMDCFEAIDVLIDRKEKVDVFFYDGNHTYKDTTLAMAKMHDIMTRDGIMIVDDTNMGNKDWNDVIGQAVIDFAKAFDYEIIFQKQTAKNGSPDWWNGVMVIQKIKQYNDDFNEQ